MHSALDGRHLPNGGPSRRVGLSGCAVLFLSLSNPLFAQDVCDSLLNVDFVVTVDGYVATFTDQTTNGLSDVHYYWDYGDGVVEHLGGYQHTYADTGLFSACLSVSGSYGGDTCANTACRDVRITRPPVPPGLLVWPQPFVDGFTVDGTMLAGSVRMEMMDTRGRVIAEADLAKTGPWSFWFPSLAAGCYVLRLSGPYGSQVIPVAKE